MATVHVSNISPKTSEKEIKDFFSFCGKISDISITPSSSEPNAPLSATVTFERESAAKTALLLDNTPLGDSAVKVETTASLDELSKSAAEDTAGQPDNSEDIRQEDKPRSAVLAEYLAHGYVIGDKALEKGIELDEKHGVTQKFTAYLNKLDQRFKATDKARAVDNTYGVTDKTMQGVNTLQRYFESTALGRNIREFYKQGSKQVMDIHAEARRLADLKKKSSKCTCGGDSGVCTCPDGKCTCAGCAKPGPSSTEERYTDEPASTGEKM